MNTPALRAWLLARCGERSTVVAGLSALALLGGWAFDPAKIEAIATIAALVNSLMLAVTPEQKAAATPPPASPSPPAN